MSASSQMPGGSTLELEFAQLSDVGKVRDHNEDCCGYWLPETPEQIQSHGWLFAVADGVGGHALGEVASRLAIESLTEGFRRAKPGEPHTTVLQRLVQAANTRIYEAGKEASPGGVNMATTIVACALRYDRAVVAHVGDSRCYLIRRGHTTQLTRDHTVVADQVRLGVMSAKEAAQAETRHLLSRSVGHDLFVAVDTSELQVESGDVLMLCSDGLHGPIPVDELADVVSSHPNLEYAARKLVDLANQRDGADNATLQLIHILRVERVGMYRGRPYKLRT
ncbi:MAG TPA: protein phosphatase 2C domain-containing protein [Bryobacteraceae bacterium]|nr:protein phosphatase 2C domain-containing protein [Bryobacteraceae bacterium]